MHAVVVRPDKPANQVSYAMKLNELNPHKALDIVDHTVLLQELRDYGLDENAIRWFLS